MTKLGRLVKDGKIKSLEEIYLFSLPIKVSIGGTVTMSVVEISTRQSSVFSVMTRVFFVHE